MGDIVDLAGARVIHAEQQLEEHVEIIDTILGRLSLLNKEQKIRTLIVLRLDYNNETYTTMEGDDKDVAAVLGAIEILKSDILTSLRAIREHIETQTTED